MRRTPGWLSLVVVLLLPGVAAAHAVLLDPMPRNPNDFNKDETLPCGADTPRSANPTVYRPGQTVTVKWQETIEHPGHYELAFSASNDQNFQNMGGDIADVGGASQANPVQYQADITLPDQECETCTIRMIQVLGDDNNTEYFSCADIAIRAPAVDGDGSPIPDPDGGPSPPPGIGDPPGLCAVTPGRHTSPWSAIWMSLGAVLALGAGWVGRSKKK
jgi:hypothetical protein